MSFNYTTNRRLVTIATVAISIQSIGVDTTTVTKIGQNKTIKCIQIDRARQNETEGQKFLLRTKGFTDDSFPTNLECVSIIKYLYHFCVHICLYLDKKNNQRCKN